MPCLCSFCGNRLTPGISILCPGCKAVNYCSETCRDIDRDNHSTWCSSMSEWMKMEETLIQLPFTFTKDISLSSVTRSQIDSWLFSQGLSREGYWTSVFSPLPGQKKNKYGKPNPSDNVYMLPSESIILEFPADNVRSSPLKSWKEYYEWRGFRLDSPISALLHWPLTLYHIVQNLAPHDFPNVYASDISSLDIHILGAEIEASMPKLFQELENLLPGISFNIHFYGPSIAKSVDGLHTQFGRVHLFMHRGLYHEVVVQTKSSTQSLDGLYAQLGHVHLSMDQGEDDDHNVAQTNPSTSPKPHLVIGYNAGLAAYPTWKDTLTYLTHNNIPSYFTDYCLGSMALSDKVLKDAGIGQLSAPVTNPFRSPVSVPSDSHNLPCYSNAFISSLKQLGQ